jgi:AraC-like DNA-binding protein
MLAPPENRPDRPDVLVVLPIRPRNVLESPGVVVMDVMSDVLLAVRLTGAVFFDVTARAPFATESPSTTVVGRQVMADADHVIGFHVVTRGSCWTETLDRPEPPRRLHAGEMVIYPAGDANTMASAPGLRGRPDLTRYDRPVDSALPFTITMNADADAEECHFVCGFLGCHTRPFNPLLESLPAIVSAPVPPASWQWMSRLLDAAVQATGHGGAGREAMLAKLAELMFVEALRSHLESLPSDARGWIAGLRDPQVGRALEVIHARPGEAWTLDTLARAVGMARSSFAERFATYVGMPPMHYLSRWRLQLASRLLEDGHTVARAAATVGYQSEAAFTRAFKRFVGQPPGAWRRARSADRGRIKDTSRQ